MTQLEKMIESLIQENGMSYSHDEAGKFYEVVKEEMKIACKSKRLFWFEMEFDNFDLELQDRAYLKRRLKTALKSVLENPIDKWVEIFSQCYKAYKNPKLFGKKF